jgi:inhibitor of cysteine peptidase
MRPLGLLACVVLVAASACGGAKKAGPNPSATPVRVAVQSLRAPDTYQCTPKPDEHATVKVGYEVDGATGAEFAVDSVKAAEGGQGLPRFEANGDVGSGEITFSFACDGRDHSISLTFQAAESGKVADTQTRTVTVRAAAASPSPSPSRSPGASPTAGASARPSASPSPTASPTPRPSPKDVTAGESDNGKAVSMVAGDRLILTLDENPSTGRHWDFEAQPNGAVLRRLGDEYSPPPGTPSPGAGGQHVWRFEAVGAGSTQVKLALVPPGGGEPEKRYLLTVHVAD